MKLIELSHKVCSYSCMINGLEDLYEQKTGVRLPDYLFLHLSGLLGFVYIKNKNAPTPRMVFWGSNIARYQYEALADVVGFRWQMMSDRSFRFTLKRAKKAIDRESPALLGALDMYHLPYYEKFYHNFHVPIHHVLMVGYDDAQETVFVLDCDRPDVQSIPYLDLEQAWNVHISGLGKKNTFYTFDFNVNVANVESITRNGLRKRADEMLAAPVSMLGLKGMRKLACELPLWPEALSPSQLDTCLRHLAEFTGFPPVPPSQLTGPSDAPNNHAAGRDVFASLLRGLAEDYSEPSWGLAAIQFEQSAAILIELTDTVCDFILGKINTLEPASQLLNKIADIEQKGFEILM